MKNKDVIVRTLSAGVFAGTLKSLQGQTATLEKARRLWCWAGAASLSQLSQSGTSNPGECKFPEEVQEVILTQVIEVLNLTPAAKASIKGVPIWKV